MCLRTIVLMALLVASPCSASASVSDADLSWLAGSWCGGEDGELVEETWLAPVHGELIGMSRTSKDGRTTMFEFARIARVDGVLSFLAQPRGAAATAFRASGAGVDWIGFENPGHDFPKRIQYRRDGAGLLAEIAGPDQDGKEQVLAYRYQPCPETPVPGA
jgi:hypothetical protein